MLTVPDPDIATPHPAVDLFRVGVLISGAAVTAVSLIVIVAYMRALIRTHRIAPGTWMGLVPRHVVCVTVSYLTYVIVGVIGVIGRVHDPFRWQSAAYLVANLIGLWAMWDVLSVERRRLFYLGNHDPGKNCPEDVVTAQRKRARRKR